VLPESRSSVPAGAGVWRFDDFVLDTARYELRCGDSVIRVEPQVFDVMIHLVGNNERVVTKEELFDSVWGGRFVGEAALTSRIKAARRALRDDGKSQRYIRTIRGRGYRFVGNVTTDCVAGAAPPQHISFCQAADGVRLAYAKVGEGPPLVRAANWMTHLAYDIESPVCGIGSVTSLTGTPSSGTTSAVAACPTGRQGNSRSTTGWQT